MISATNAEIAKFVRTSVVSSKAKKVLLIAHSMGNRALLHALDDMFDKPLGTDFRPSVVFAAPDVSAKDFKRLTVKVEKLPSRMTLYASRYDETMQLSKLFNRKNDPGMRAGDAGSLPQVAWARLDAIDASLTPAELMGHAYFVNSSSILKDIYALFRENKSPEDRRLNRKKLVNNSAYIYEIR